MKTGRSQRLAGDMPADQQTFVAVDERGCDAQARRRFLARGLVTAVDSQERQLLANSRDVAASLIFDQEILVCDPAGKRLDQNVAPPKSQ